MKNLTNLIAFAFASLLASGTAVADSSSTRGDARGVKAQSLGNVYFGFDSSHVGDAAMKQLAKLSIWAQEHPDRVIILDGHTDTIGASPYNVALSIHRAQMVRSKLVAMGVDDDRIVLSVYGEDDSRGDRAALDRRVRIWTTDAPLGSVVNDALTRGHAAIWQQPVTTAQLEDKRDSIAIALGVRAVFVPSVASR